MECELECILHQVDFHGFVHFKPLRKNIMLFGELIVIILAATLVY